ncbi:hypothetical protein K438DRAFT_1772736 [Mycena galopus ATCC 62051]|nr:hypothetical protein K438DRAFT_1772736 [Mycena galopus ATCC 62051]
MKQKQYTCDCELRPHAHRVFIEDRADHENLLALLLAQHTAYNNAAASTSQVLDTVGATELNDYDGLERLADYVTALTLTDEGPIPANQPSKFFTSRTEFQENHADIPSFDTSAVTAVEAMSSISAIFEPTPSNWRDDRAAELTSQIGKQIREAEETLAIPAQYDDANPAAVAEMHEKLNAAARTFFNCKASLDGIQRIVANSADARAALEGLYEKIQSVETELKMLDAKITVIGAALLPLVYDANGYFHHQMHHVVELVAKPGWLGGL